MHIDFIEDLEPQEEIEKMDRSNMKIGLFVGKYKPPHRGHYFQIENASIDNDLVYIVISPREVENITAEQSKEILEIYTENLGNVIIDIADISPVKTIYDFIEGINKFIAEKEFELNMYTAEEDKTRYMNFINKKDKYTYNFDSVNIKTSERYENIKARNLRTAIKNNDWSYIRSKLPNHLDNKQKDRVIDILK